MKLNVTIVPAVLLIWASTAWSVSRVGTGKISNSENGFLASVPIVYRGVVVAANQDLRFEGQGVYSPGRFVPPRTLLVFMLTNIAPEWLANGSRDEFRDHYLRNGWVSVTHANPCIEQLEKTSGGGFNRILSWGQGKGVQVAAPMAYAEDVRTTTESVELEQGFCRWN